MNTHISHIATTVLFVVCFGCSGNRNPKSNDHNIEANVQSPEVREVKTDLPNEAGYSKISIRDGETYLEGIVDSKGYEVLPARANLLVNDITGQLALVQIDRKFLFVPLAHGPLVWEDLEIVQGFQYAEPYQCGLALVSVDDGRFYIDSNFKKAFDSEFEFAESFHHDRALVKDRGQYRILDTHGNTVAKLDYEGVSQQSPWCWQVNDIHQERYRHGFIDLNGKPIADLIYDEVGYYDPAVKRIGVSKNNLHGFLNEHAVVVIPVEYDYAEPFDRGKARVSLGGRTFFIDPNGIEVPE